MSEHLYLTRIVLRSRSAMQLARLRGLRLAGGDPGYLLHSVLREAFQELAPQPFALTRGGAGGNGSRHQRAGAAGTWELLAYGAGDAEALRMRLRQFAPPEVFSVLDESALATKPMPPDWAAQMRLEFEVRVCPVVRQAGTNGGKPREQDAFLAEVQRVGPDIAVDREAVYRKWLCGELGRDGAANLGHAHMTAFRRVRLERRDRSRKVHNPERPDVSFQGELTVTDGAAFAALLRRGLGRHRAFGFGMVLVRPARTAA